MKILKRIYNKYHYSQLFLQPRKYGWFLGHYRMYYDCVWHNAFHVWFFGWTWGIYGVIEDYEEKEYPDENQ